MATNALAVGNGLTDESVALNQVFGYLANSIDATALLTASMSRKMITEWQRSQCASEPDPKLQEGGDVFRSLTGMETVTNFTRLYKFSTKPIKTNFAVIAHNIKTLSMDA